MITSRNLIPATVLVLAVTSGTMMGCGDDDPKDTPSDPADAGSDAVVEAGGRFASRSELEET